MADLKNLMAKASEKSEQGSEKAPFSYFKSFKPNLGFRFKGTQIRFKDYILKTDNEKEIIAAKEAVVRGIAREISEKEVFFGPDSGQKRISKQEKPSESSE